MGQMSEVRHSIRFISDIKTMESYIIRQTSEGIAELFLLLETMDKETQEKWETAYSNLMMSAR